MIQKFLFRILKTAFKLTQMFLPGIAGKWVVKLFFSPRKFNRPKWESDFLKNAQKKRIPFKSSYKLGSHEDYYIRYEWGADGSPAVLLVHGWEGRGSQMGYFVQPLLNAGYRVITFDAIAHGDSPGMRTNMPEFAQIIKNIEKDTGRFHAIIGHSLGGTAAGYAIAEGVHSDRLITICSPTTIQFIFDAFQQQINASQKTMRRLEKFLEDFTGKKSKDYSFTNFAGHINTPGLIIHDKQDKEIPYSQALALHETWKKSQLVLKEGLGHRRILRDEMTISKIVRFVKDLKINENQEVALTH